MEKIYQIMLRIEKWMGKIVILLTGSMLFAITGIIFIQVIFRYILHNSLSWSEELTRYLMVWMIFLGTGYVLGQKAHSSMDMIVKKLPEKIQFISEKLNAVLLVFFSYIIIRYGFELMMLGTKQKSSALQIPMNYVYLGIPIGGVILLFYSLLTLVERKVESV